MALNDATLIRIGLAVSLAVHAAFLFAATARPTLATTHGETVTVDLVTPEEVPQPKKEQPQQPQPQQQAQPKQQATPPLPPQPPAQQQSKPDPKTPGGPMTPPAPIKPPQAAAPKPVPQQQQQAALPAPPQPLPDAEPVPDKKEPAAPAVDVEKTGSKAETKAKLSDDEIAAFMARLKSCWKVPTGVSPTQKLTVVVRVALKPDGSLAADPMLIEATASEMGPPILQSAFRALKQCAPYTMLPAEKYKEWKILDIDFSPDLMSRG